MISRLAGGRMRRALPRHRPGALAGAALVAALAALAAAPAAPAAETETAAIAPGTLRVTDSGIPGVLSPADEARYRRIFAAQEAGDWAAADRAIAELDSDLLLGHVLFQRYMHPTEYRSRFDELRDWMAAYADHPEARRIYRLAVRRMPAGAGPPRDPLSHGRVAAPGRPAVAGHAPEAPRRSRAEAAEVRRLEAEIAARVRRGWPTGAVRVLDSAPARGLLTAFETARARTLIARGYFRAGKDGAALQQADLAAAHGDALPMAHWWGGLAAWRQGRPGDAYAHFTGLARSRHASPWTMAAGAYWASRAALADRRPAEVNRWLRAGAAHPYTFYGVLSRRALALDPGYDWEPPPLTAGGAAAVAAEKAGRRGLALIQAGRPRLAGLELHNLAARRPELAPQLAALASRAGIAALAFRLSASVADETGAPVPALMFPVPAWQPDGGFRIDRALVYAFIRQESKFDVRARSRAGARGLMQLMPVTAGYIAGQRELEDRRRHELFDPGLNIALGQRYLDYLMDHRDVGPDLFRLAAAYNGGPGNLLRWQRETDFNGDPLLFIETLPAHETRLFIERVLTNLWIYRDRLGQPTPALDAVIAGDWPTYVPLDAAVTAAAPGP